MRLAPGVAIILLSVLVGCDDGPVPEAALPTPSPTQQVPGLLIDFEAGLETGDRLDERSLLDNSGRAATLGVGVRTNGPVRLEVVAGPGGEGHAIRFPAYTPSPDTPAAVVVATDDGLGTLDPDDGEFSFGARFLLDAESEGNVNDDGNNLLQRGVFESPGQIKIQIDGGLPSCRVKGDAGEVFVESEERIEPEEWYSIRCTRTEEGLILDVEPDSEPEEGDSTARASGATGAVTLTGLPFTIGGKSGPDGTPVASADQFNGVVDDVFLEKR